MRYLRLMVIAFAFLAASGIAGASWVQAQDLHIYPSTGPCDGLPAGFSYWFAGDPDAGVAGYEACDITGITDLGEYIPDCPLEGMTFDVGIGGCFFMEALPDDPPTGGHQPWREGERGHCDLDSVYLCDLWQQWIELPDESGNCPEGQTLVPGSDSVLEIDTCQYLSDGDTSGEELPVSDEPTDTSTPDVVIIGNGGAEVMVLPNTGSGSIQHDSGLIYFLAAIVLTTLSGCAFRRGLARS